MSFKPTRASDKYIKLRHTVTNKDVLNIVLILANEKLLKPQQICELFICEGAKRELDRRKQLLEKNG